MSTISKESVIDLSSPDFVSTHPAKWLTGPTDRWWKGHFGVSGSPEWSWRWNLQCAHCCKSSLLRHTHQPEGVWWHQGTRLTGRNTWNGDTRISQIKESGNNWFQTQIRQIHGQTCCENVQSNTGREVLRHNRRSRDTCDLCLTCVLRVLFFLSFAAFTPISVPTETPMEWYWSTEDDWFWDHVPSAQQRDQDDRNAMWLQARLPSAITGLEELDWSDIVYNTTDMKKEAHPNDSVNQTMASRIMFSLIG